MTTTSVPLQSSNNTSFPRLEARVTLEAHRIDVRLRGRPVLHSVNAVIAPGRITAVIGPNGAGKSTLLRALAGLITPDLGTVTIDGRGLASLGAEVAARAIAYLPQERVVHWPLSVQSVVALGRLPHGGALGRLSPIDGAAVERAMQAMDIAALADRRVDSISGGERARVLFARALAQEAPIILADEPTAGLDPAHGLELAAVLQRLAADGRAIALATHDLTLAARFCHDAVLISTGRVVASGPVAEILAPAQLGTVFGVTMAVGRIDNAPVVVPMSLPNEMRRS